MHFRQSVTLILAATFCTLAATAHAQFPGGGGAGSGGSGGMGRGGMSRGPSAGNHDAAPRVPDAAELLQIQLGELEEDLKLAPGQRKAWDLYKQRVAQFAGDIGRTRNALRYPKGDAPQQFDFIADVLRNRVTAIEDIGDAGKSLYAQLNPEQREVADRRLARVTVALIDAVQPVGGGGGLQGQGGMGRGPATQ
jgi:hypothetical protein